MQPSANKNKKMVTNIKKRKSNMPENEPKAKSPKKSGPGANSPASKNVISKSVKAQIPKSPVVKTPATRGSAAMKPKPTPVGKKGNKPKKNMNQKTPLPKIVKNDESIDKSEELDKTESSEGEQEASPVLQQGLNEIGNKKPTHQTKGRPHKRQSIKEKFVNLKGKIEIGDKTALKEVQEVIKKIESRGELSRTAKRKLRIYKRILEKPKATTPAKPKASKAKKNKK